MLIDFTKEELEELESCVNKIKCERGTNNALDIIHNKIWCALNNEEIKKIMGRTSYGPKIDPLKSDLNRHP